MAKQFYNISEITFQPLLKDHRFKNLTGQRFDRLTVLGFAGMDTHSYWFCQCDCGVIKRIFTSHLTLKRVRSCGCLMRERVSTRMTTHGLWKTSTARIYILAKHRCNNPNAPAYAKYGGRGIEFRFNNLTELVKDIGMRPSKTHSLDRINNDGHYEIGNVRWATRREQANNKQNNTILTVNGESRTLAQWARRSPVTHAAISYRIKKMKWCNHCAISLPVNSQCNHVS